MPGGVAFPPSSFSLSGLYLRESSILAIVTDLFVHVRVLHKVGILLTRVILQGPASTRAISVR